MLAVSATETAYGEVLMGEDEPSPGVSELPDEVLEDVSDEELAKVPITYVDGLNDKWQSAPPFFRHL